MGPLANARRVKRAEDLVADALARGATLHAGEHRSGGRGLFFEPTVLTEVPDDADLMKVEPFGPVASSRSYTDIDEAIELANSLPYGLAAYGFTASAARANVRMRRLEAGIMSINHVGGSVAAAPSGASRRATTAEQVAWRASRAIW